VEIELRYFDDCPNWQVTDTMLVRLLDDLGIDVEVRHTLVDTPEAAERLSFRGSPTVVINGSDPFADPEDPIGLSCRLYRTEMGLAGSPSEAQLRSVLQASR
jgi:hypothetical protein